MNIINVKVNFTKGTCETSGINLITGDYNSTKMVFEFDREDGTKIFEMKSPSEQLVMVQEIQNNEIPLYALTDEDEIASLFSEDGYYVFEISLYNEGSKLTSVSSKIKVKPEQVVIDGEVVEAYLPVFDQLLTEVNEALTETGNLDISVSKSGKTATITLTDKEGESHTTNIYDGKDFEYNWSGTQLGVRQEGEPSYTYVDLKGDKGDAGAIKMIIVAELPATGQDDTIYLVPITPDTTGNNYAEYVYINGAWELLGKIGVQVDLTDYVKNTDYASSSKGGVIKTTDGCLMRENGTMYCDTRAYSNYTGAGNSLFISKGTLENVITGKGLTTKSYVDGLVGDIGTAIDGINGEVI